MPEIITQHQRPFKSYKSLPFKVHYHSAWARHRASDCILGCWYCRMKQKFEPHIITLTGGE